MGIIERETTGLGQVLRGACMKTIVLALAMIAVFAAPAYSQGGGKGGRHATATDQQTEAQKKKASATEKDYKAALDKIPDKKISDPWGNVR